MDGTTGDGRELAGGGRETRAGRLRPQERERGEGAVQENTAIRVVDCLLKMNVKLQQWISSAC